MRLGSANPHRATRNCSAASFQVRHLVARLPPAPSAPYVRDVPCVSERASATSSACAAIAVTSTRVAKGAASNAFRKLIGFRSLWTFWL